MMIMIVWNPIVFLLFCRKVASLKRSSFHWNQPESGAGGPAPWPPVMEDSLVVFVTKPLSTWAVRDDTYYYPRIQACIIGSYSIHEWRYCFGPTHYCISMGNLAKFGPELELFFFSLFPKLGLTRGKRGVFSLHQNRGVWPVTKPWQGNKGFGWLERAIIDQVQLLNLSWNRNFWETYPHLPFLEWHSKWKHPHINGCISFTISSDFVFIPRISPTRSQTLDDNIHTSCGSGDLVEVSDGRVQEGLAKACLHERTPRDGLCARWWRWSGNPSWSSRDWGIPIKFCWVSGCYSLLWLENCWYQLTTTFGKSNLI